MPYTDLIKYEKTLKALANRRRLAIIRLLTTGEEKPVGAIVESIKLSYKSTSKHLGVLYTAGLLEREQRGSEMYYRRIARGELTYPAKEIISML